MKKYFVVLIFNFALLTFNLFAQWQPDVRLTNDPDTSYTSANNAWCVAANGNVVHVIWGDHRDGNWEIYYKRSTDSGVNWGTDTRLTNNPANSKSHSISVLGSVVHIVWEDDRDGNYEIYYKRSTNEGINWSSDIRLTNTPGASRSPSMSVLGSNVHVVWQDDARIYYKRSTNVGTNWGADIPVTNNPNGSYHGSISVSGLIAHVVWYAEIVYDNTEIYYNRSTNEGLNWGADIRLTHDSSASWLPCIAASGSDVHVVWTDLRDANYETYYKLSSNGGMNWGADTRLTYNNPFGSSYPSLAASGSTVHLVYGGTEISYNISTNGGISWGTETRLTYNPTTYSYSPSVAVSGSQVNVVWFDGRDGNYEIYYKRNPTGNAIGIININSEIPNKFLLHQNYPNPFNPTTKIKFELPKSGKVEFTVYDVLGNLVSSISEEIKSAGIYEIDFDGSSFSSGVYFYKLRAGDFIDTKKMILIK